MSAGGSERPDSPVNSISTDGLIRYTTNQRAVQGVFISRTEIEHLIDCSWQFSLFVGLSSAAVFFGAGVLISYLSVTEHTPFFNGVALALGAVSVILTVLFGALAVHEFGRRSNDIENLFGPAKKDAP
jgi:hypothetical protein